MVLEYAVFVVFSAENIHSNPTFPSHIPHIAPHALVSSSSIPPSPTPTHPIYLNTPPPHPLLPLSQDVCVQPRRIALFSLGNFCVYSICRERVLQIMDPPLNAVLDDLTATSGDATLLKYAARVRSKLSQPAH